MSKEVYLSDDQKADKAKHDMIEAAKTLCDLNGVEYTEHWETSAVYVKLYTTQANPDNGREQEYILWKGNLNSAA